MFEKFRPLNDRVLVERLEAEERTESGLYVPETHKEKPQRGKVIAVGTGYRDADGSVSPLVVQIGDIVFFGKYAGTEAGDKHIVMSEKDILGIIEQ